MLAGLKWIAPFFAGWLFLSGAAQGGTFSDEVWTYSEFSKVHPEQRPVFDRFNSLVKKTAPPAIETPFTKPISIVMVYPGAQVSDYWRRSQHSFEARLRQSNVVYTLDSLFTESAKDVRQQESYIHQALKKRPDYMVFTLDALRHKSVIERIIGRKSIKLILQNITTPLKSWEGSQPFLYVGFDHEIGSRMLADEYIRLTKGEGDYAVLFGPPGYVSEMRGNTFIQYISDNSDLKMKASYYVGFDRARAKQATLDLLDKTPDLRFIYACSTDIALGVIDGLREKNMLGKIMVNGWGGGSAELDALATNDLDFTVMRMNDDNGVAMADAIILDRNGKADEIPQVFSGEIVLITQNLRRDAISAIKKQAFRYSGE